MPRTADRITNNESFRERSTIMGTMRADGKESLAAAYEDDLFFAHMAGYHSTVWE
jgi:hypothetical protein